MPCGGAHQALPGGPPTDRGRDRLRPMRVREPFNAGSHFVGFLLAALGTWYLLQEANGRAQLLAASWAIAAAGIPFKIRWLDAPVWVSTSTYLGMGYLALVAVAPLAREVGGGLGWLVAGGVAYTVGAIIYAVERPDPFPGRFGHHGLWHLLVLTGSACHFIFILLHVASF